MMQTTCTYNGKITTIDDMILSLTTAAVFSEEDRKIQLPLTVGRARALARMLETAKAADLACQARLATAKSHEAKADVALASAQKKLLAAILWNLGTLALLAVMGIAAAVWGLA